MNGWMGSCGKEGSNYSLKTSVTVREQDCARKSIISPKLILIIAYGWLPYWWHQCVCSGRTWLLVSKIPLGLCSCQWKRNHFKAAFIIGKRKKIPSDLWVFLALSRREEHQFSNTEVSCYSTKAAQLSSAQTAQQHLCGLSNVKWSEI